MLWFRTTNSTYVLDDIAGELTRLSERPLRDQNGRPSRLTLHRARLDDGYTPPVVGQRWRASVAGVPIHTSTVTAVTLGPPRSH